MMNKLISYFGTFTPGADGAVGAFQFEYLTSLGFAALVIFAGRAIVRRSHDCFSATIDKYLYSELKVFRDMTKQWPVRC